MWKTLGNVKFEQQTSLLNVLPEGKATYYQFIYVRDKTVENWRLRGIQLTSHTLKLLLIGEY